MTLKTAKGTLAVLSLIFSTLSTQAESPHFKSTPLDSLLKDDLIPIDSIYSTKELSQGAHLKKATKSSKKGTLPGYRIQLSTVADFDLAQQQRQEYSKHLGSSVDIVFDPPFYKLRYGLYPTKKEANNSIEELQSLGLQGFIVQAD